MALKNLALEKKYEIITHVPMEKSYASCEKGEKNMLTDGITGDPKNFYGGDWAHFYRGFGRSIVIDLGDIYAVSGFDAGFIHDRNSGIYCPERVSLSLSENGTDFHTVSEAEAPYPASFAENVRAVYTGSTDFPFRARFAKITFDVDVNVFLDDIKIFGEDLSGSEHTLSGEPEHPIYKNCFAHRDSLGGVHDIPLIYCGYWPENEHIAKSTKEELLPYIAYMKDGKIQDTMFDSLLFLFVQGRCPSGGCLGYHAGPSLLSDWEYMLDVLFEQGYSLSAANEAFGEVKSALNLPARQKLKIYLTAPVPKISLEPFGDMNGDGIEEKLLSTQDCIDAYLWFVDQAARRFEAAGLDNLEIDGYFWINETISRSTRDDEEFFARGCVEGLHARGLKSVFIPFFQAGGCQKYESVGFDVATMQPNLSFNKPLQADPDGAMEDFVEACRKYGFGIELEIHQGVKNPETRDIYTEYFNAYMRSGIKSGMMTDSVHTYYQCAGPGVFYDCALSDDPYLRKIYENLYKYIKGTLTPEDLELPAEPTSEEAEPAEESSFCACEEDILCHSGDASEEEEPEAASKLRITKRERRLSNRTKKILIGAGIAAAALGIAYWLSKRNKK